MNLYPFILIGGIFLLSFWATGYLSRSSFSFKFLDHPNDRSLHTRPTPRTGGIAIVGAIIAGFLVATFREPAAIDTKMLWILSMTLFLALLSFWDVKSGLPQGWRLLGHFLAAAGIVVGCGLKIQSISVPLLGHLYLGWMAIPATLIMLVWMTNLYNFMDGMDGFAGGMAVFGFGFFGLLVWISGNSSLGLQSGIIAAAAGGFLLYNLPPARIFMGDVGSIPIGFLAGVFALRAFSEGLFGLWVFLLIFSPFIADATITLFRRIIAKKKLWMPHREHYYQRIALAGCNHLKTVLMEYLLMLASGLSALVYIKTTAVWQFVILIGWVAIYAVIAYSVSQLDKNQTA